MMYEREIDFFFEARIGPTGTLGDKESVQNPHGTEMVPLQKVITLKDVHL